MAYGDHNHVLRQTAQATARQVGGSYEGQLVPDSAIRKYGDPIVLICCGHRHRTERAAVQCVQRLRGGRGKRRGN